jgi:hypothetical protein
VGTEDPRTLVAHLIKAAESCLEHERKGFIAGFPSPDEIDTIYRKHYADVHTRYAESLAPMTELLK